MSDSVIPASSVRLKTMADGSLQVTINVEPYHAQTAFLLFGMPGTPMALAALKVGTQVDQTPEPDPPPEPAKGGPLARWAALRCQDDRFRSWLDVSSEATARAAILMRCGIHSRAELDSNTEAAGLFARHFRRPWHEHCLRNGWVD